MPPAQQFIGVAFAVTMDSSALVVVFGLVPWARFGAWAGVLAGILGVAVIIQTIRARRQKRLPVGTLLGFLLTGLAAIGLSSFMLVWDLGPF